MEKEIKELDKENVDEIKSFNKRAWDISVEQNNRWTEPISSELVAKAKRGDFDLLLSPKTPVPKSWHGELSGKRVLGLASGGGQQGPLLAASGAKVTVADISSKQLEQDSFVAKRDGLDITTLQCSADDLKELGNDSFDLIVNPVSNCFFPNLQPVWSECARVLRSGGELLTAFNNPISYCFDFEKANRGHFEMKYPLPFSDLKSFDEIEKGRFLRKEAPLEYSHTLSTQIGGIIRAGFSVIGFFEDTWDTDEPIDKYFPQFICLRARKD